MVRLLIKEPYNRPLFYMILTYDDVINPDLSSLPVIHDDLPPKLDQDPAYAGIQ